MNPIPPEMVGCGWYGTPITRPLLECWEVTITPEPAAALLVVAALVVLALLRWQT